MQEKYLQNNFGLLVPPSALQASNKRYELKDKGINGEYNKFAPIRFEEFRDRLMLGEIEVMTPPQLAIGAIESYGSESLGKKSRMYGKEMFHYYAFSSNGGGDDLHGMHEPLGDFMKALKTMEMDGGTKNFIFLIAESGDGKSTLLRKAVRVMRAFSREHPLYKMKDCENSDSPLLFLDEKDKESLKGQGIHVYGDGCAECQMRIMEAGQDPSKLLVQPYVMANGIGEARISPMWSMSDKDTVNMQHVFDAIKRGSGGVIVMDEAGDQIPVLVKIKDYLRGKYIDDPHGSSVFSNVLFLAALTRRQYEDNIGEISKDIRWRTQVIRDMEALVDRSFLVIWKHNLDYFEERKAVEKHFREALPNNGIQVHDLVKQAVTIPIILSRLSNTEVFTNEKSEKSFKLSPEQKLLLYIGKDLPGISDEVIDKYAEGRDMQQDGRIGISPASVEKMVKQILLYSEGRNCVNVLDAFVEMKSYYDENFSVIPADNSRETFHDQITKAETYFNRWLFNSVMSAMVEDYKPHQKEKFTNYWYEIGKLFDLEIHYSPAVRLSVEEGKSVPNSDTLKTEENIQIGLVHSIENMVLTAQNKPLTDAERVILRHNLDYELKRLTLEKMGKGNGRRNGKLLSQMSITNPAEFLERPSGLLKLYADAILTSVTADKGEKAIIAGHEPIQTPEEILKSLLKPGIQKPDQRERIKKAAEVFIQEHSLCPHCAGEYFTYLAQHIDEISLESKNSESKNDLNILLTV